MPNSWVFADPVYGPTVFGPREVELIETAEFTRLHRIRQLATLYLLYPAADHTRFEHSLGVAGLTRRFLISVLGETSLDRVFLVTAAALLHDIGHPGWAHAGELFMRYRGIRLNHDELSAKLILGEEDVKRYFVGKGLRLVSDVLGSEERQQIAMLVRGRAPVHPHIAAESNVSEIARAEKELRYLGQIISHPAVDFDRLEYLIRDAFYTTASAGFFALADVFKSLGRGTVVGGAEELVCKVRAFAEAMVLTRELMYASVYHRSENLIAEEMLARAFNICFDTSQDPLSVWFKTDDQLLQEFYDNPSARSIAELIRNRRVYLNCWEGTFEHLSGDTIQRLGDMAHNRPKVLEFERELAEGITEPKRVLLCVHASEPAKEPSIWVMEPGYEPVDLLQAASLIAVLGQRRYHLERSRLILAVDPGVEEGTRSRLRNKFMEMLIIKE